MNLLFRFTKTILLIECLLFFFSFVSVSHAQIDSFKTTVLPQFPGAYQSVRISVEDFSKDLNRVSISWSVNGKVIQKGTGLKEFQTKTGALGSVSNISINIGGNVHTLTIRPAAIDLIWQADSYTPPFYKGKALHSNQDPLTVVADPFIINSQGARLDPDKLIYRWKQAGSVMQKASGYGKKVFQASSSILPQPIDITVDVSSTDNIYHSSASITIPESKPEVLLYENHPLFGIHFNKALNGTNFTLTTPELNIVAAPFFFSNGQRDSLSYDWKLNGTAINQQNNEVTFRKPNATDSGQSSVSVDVKNPERFMQTSNASANVQFSKQSTNSNSQGVF